jgi:hypothetical protein
MPGKGDVKGQKRRYRERQKQKKIDEENRIYNNEIGVFYTCKCGSVLENHKPSDIKRHEATHKHRSSLNLNIQQ